MTEACLLEDRALIRISGADAHGWLQGLVTNDLELLSNEHALYSALLSPQGKILFDFFVIEDSEDILIDCEASRRDELAKRLTLYKLRSAVSVSVDDELCVFALFGEDSIESVGLLEEIAGSVHEILGGLAIVDPRLARMGVRVIGNKHRTEEDLEAIHIDLDDNADTYHQHRLALGISNGAQDLLPDKSFVLESNLEEMNGVSFSKGCFIGQEVTARTKHKSEIRKRILPISSTAPLPEERLPIRAGESEVGTLLSGQDRSGLALIRLDRWRSAAEAGDTPQIDGQSIEIKMPSWLNTQPA